MNKEKYIKEFLFGRTGKEYEVTMIGDGFVNLSSPQMSMCISSNGVSIANGGSSEEIARLQSLIHYILQISIYGRTFDE